ncbi:Acetyl esterase/lipase [Micromonospora viridifaciens]|uniref:Acetyl esterase/lipase n=1 Tax=Micromonospora viridifaciens TaxID=1881 RepID=A0A1C4WVL6_MICVI|nr:alpha/beta hydrolase [Micromonospora viridifaciens]SCF00262.1 Acetyl esterase/lipase [Micromonospora viridifaciens]
MSETSPSPPAVAAVLAPAAEHRPLRRGPLLITSLLAVTAGALIYLAPLAAVWRTAWPYALLFAALGAAQLGTVARVLARPASRRVVVAAAAALAVLVVWFLTRGTPVLPGPSPWIPADSVIGFVDYICAGLQVIGVVGFGIVWVLRTVAAARGPEAQAPRRPRLRRAAGAAAVAPVTLVVLLAAFVGFGGASDGFAGAGFPGDTVAPRHLPAGKRSTVEYCRVDGVPLAMDVYAPPGGAATPGRGAPAAMYIHGGGLVLGDRKLSGLGASLSNHEAALFPPLRERLNANGYLVASIDYRLTPAAPWPAPLVDASCAVRFLRAHAADLGIDPSRIGVWGASGGGWLSSMLGLTGRQGGSGPYAEQSSAVQAVVDMFGPTDLNDFTDAPPFIRFLLWAGIGTSTATRHSASPINCVTSEAPPFLIVHGAQDEDVAPRQSVRFAERLRTAGVSAEFVEVAGTGHTLATPGQHPSTQEVTDMVVDFFMATLR